MFNKFNVLFLVLLLSVLNSFHIVDAARNFHVTCGTVLKLLNTDYKVRLHSHDVKYGTGSGQQSVTGIELQEDVNSHWAIQAPTGQTCDRGEPIKCGETIRLHHLETNKNLHSHHFTSPLSGNQEISCYGDEQGEGDSGDHWQLLCSGDTWHRNSEVKFKHVDTNTYLAISGRSFGRPINGQMEVVSLPSPHSGSDWKAAEGLFIHPREPTHANIVHSEL